MKVDEELPIKRYNTRFIDPYYQLISEEEEEQVEDVEGIENHSKAPLRYVQKNHPKNLIIGDKNAWVQTSLKETC